MNSDRVRTHQLSHGKLEGSLIDGTPVIFEQFRFNESAEQANLFIQAILAQHKRRQWDKSVESLRMAGPIVNRNMLVFEEVSKELVSGSINRSALLKQFIFRANGALYVYTSSVQDSVAAEDDSERESAPRYCLAFQILCFRREGEDLVVERLQQIDFRQGDNESMNNLFIKAKEVKSRYWQQDLIEAVQAAK